MSSLRLLLAVRAMAPPVNASWIQMPFWVVMGTRPKEIGMSNERGLAGEVVARERAALVQRAQEGVDALGGGEGHVEVEVEAAGGQRLVGLAVGGGFAVVVLGADDTQVAIGQEMEANRVLRAEPGGAGLIGPPVEEAGPLLDGRSGRGVHVLAVVDLQLRRGVVGLRVLGIVAEQGLGIGRVVEDRGLGCNLGPLVLAGGRAGRRLVGRNGGSGGSGGGLFLAAGRGLGCVSGGGESARGPQGEQEQAGGQRVRSPGSSVHLRPPQRTTNSATE